MFLQPTKSKIVSQYGDAILKALTLDVLAELLGAENSQIINNIMPLAISNAFYEQIVLHYKLDIVYSSMSDGADTNTGNRTHARGDLLEAYMAAIEKDISREGQGYREVRQWLFNIIALRLKRFQVQNDVGSRGIYSIGTEQQSLTILPTMFADSTREMFEIESNHATTILRLETNPSIRPASQAMDLWRHPSIQSTTKLDPFTILGSTSPSWQGTSDLNHFRRFLFETMKQTVIQTGKNGVPNNNAFWTELSVRLSQLQESLEDDFESILLFYYRVSRTVFIWSEL